MAAIIPRKQAVPPLGWRVGQGTTARPGLTPWPKTPGADPRGNPRISKDFEAIRRLAEIYSIGPVAPLTTFLVRLLREAQYQWEAPRPDRQDDSGARPVPEEKGRIDASTCDFRVPTPDTGFYSCGA
jgi:hypothetical protein